MIQENRKDFSKISPKLHSALQQIVDDVVARLGCVGAIATTLENDKGLYVRASAFSLSPELVKFFVKQTGLNLTGSKALVYIDDSNHQYNLNVSAVNGVSGQSSGITHPYLVSDQLYDVLRPLTDRKVASDLQEKIAVHQVATLPLIVDTEVVGSLLVLTAVEFADRDIDFLVAFASQAAETIQNHYYLNGLESLEKVIFSLQAKMTDETLVLQAVVDAVVFGLGYEGSMVATLEEGRALPVRAYALDDRPQILAHLEEKAGIKLIGPKAVVYLDDEHYKDNLSVLAVKGIDGRPQNYLTSQRLYDLLRPVAKKSIADFAQQMLGIRSVIAVPFFIEDEIVGNLFVASRRDHFSPWEISILTSFGQQAAAGIRNARLYRETEQQRHNAEMFSRMAFSATASVHSLGNHLSTLRTYLHLLTAASSFPPTQQQDILNNSATMLDRLNKATDILENLHQPWHAIPDQPISINDCLIQSVHEVFPQLLIGFDDGTMADKTGVKMHITMGAHLPTLDTAPEMLIEAFRVIIKNAREAVNETGQPGELWISSERIAPREVKVSVRDSGVGIREDMLPHIFELGWSTKGGDGMGFGLFWTRDYVVGLGGRIEIESEWQEGTTFNIYLPTR